MKSILGLIVMGMYLPIIVMSGTACYLYITRVLIPAIRGRHFNLQTHAVALAAIMALTAHFTENIYYGIGRLHDSWYNWVSEYFPMVGLMKLLVLASSVLATMVYNKALFGATNFRRTVSTVILLWVIGFVAFYVYESTR